MSDSEFGMKEICFQIYMDQIVKNLLQSIAERGISVDLVVHYIWLVFYQKPKQSIGLFCVQSNFAILKLIHIENQNNMKDCCYFLADYMYVKSTGYYDVYNYAPITFNCVYSV